MVRKIMRSTHPFLFFSKKEKIRIVAAIQEAEEATSGEIRLRLERKFKGNGFIHAREVFERLVMTKTQERNAVLILFGLKNREFFILGDQGIDAKVPAGFWDSITQEMMTYFKEDRFSEGLAQGILKIGEKLKIYFPHQREDRNELPDRISYSL